MESQEYLIIGIIRLKKCIIDLNAFPIGVYVLHLPCRSEFVLIFE